MKRMEMFGCLLAGIGILVGVTTVCLGDEDVQLRILQLARDGRNTEVIESFEAIPGRDDLDVAVLRAVAGCYWRERRFDEARGLYRRILERQASPNVPADGDQAGALLGRELPVMDEEVLQPELAAAPVEAAPSATDAAAQGVLTQELETLRAQHQAMQEERETLRQDADARIAALTAVAAERAVEMDGMRAKLAAMEAESGPEALSERRDAVSRASALKARIASLEMAVQAANKSRDTLQAEAELKINDLLDSIEADKTKQKEVEAQLQAAADALEVQKASAAETAAGLERKVELAAVALEDERRLAGAATAQQQLREAELQTRIEQLLAAGDVSRQQVLLLEQTLGQLRGQFDEVTAQLAVSELELAKEVDRVDRASLELALEEIERLEQEQAAGDAAVAQQQALLLQQIELREKQVAESGEALAAVAGEIEKERRLRFELEAHSEAQAKELADTGAMLDEAKAALSRQYAAIREQVQAGVTMRLEDGEPGNEAQAKGEEPLITLSPDLVPLIGQLETATATAMADVKALREQLEHERTLFAATAAEKSAELETVRAEMAKVQQRVQAITEETAARTAGMEAAHAAALVAMTEAHDLRVAGLKDELDGLRKAVEARDRSIAMLEADLQAERDSSARVLAMARATEATLSARIRELETAFALPDAESDSRERAALRDTVFGSILDMIPSDKAAAITRFEALPPTSDIPDALLKAMGNLYREQGNYADACTLFEKLVERNPGDLSAERKLVMTLFDMGRYDQALDRLTGSGTTPPAK